MRVHFRLSSALVLTAAVLGLTAGCITVHVPAPAAPTSTHDSEPPVERPASTPQSATGPEDSPFSDHQWGEWGYQVVESGNIYAKFADRSTFTCGTYNCVAVEVHVAHGCPSMLYIEANVLSGETVVGMANASPGAVAPFSDVSVLLEDHRNAGDGFRLAQITCH